VAKFRSIVFPQAGIRHTAFAMLKRMDTRRYTSLAIKPSRFTPHLALYDIDVQGGNDYEIYTDPRVTGHSVSSPADTMRILKELFFS
jgi:Eukaryotic phosphomannomutase